MYSHNQGKDLFENKARELDKLSQTLSTKHILYGASDLYLEAQRFLARIKRDVESNCLSYQGGIELITEQIKHLHEQDDLITFERAHVYIVVEKQRASTTAIALKQVGFVAGGVQIFGGASLCVGSLGLACAAYGAPMMLHGTNNLYENGYYLLYRKEKTGTVKEAYRYAAAKLGYNNNTADVVYGGVDILLSGYGATRKVLAPREKSWSLFHNIKSDYIRGWQEASKTSLALDLTSSSITGWQMYQLGQNNQLSKEN